MLVDDVARRQRHQPALRELAALGVVRPPIERAEPRPGGPATTTPHLGGFGVAGPPAGVAGRAGRPPAQAAPYLHSGEPGGP